MSRMELGTIRSRSDLVLPRSWLASNDLVSSGIHLQDIPIHLANQHILPADWHCIEPDQSSTGRWQPCSWLTTAGHQGFLSTDSAYCMPRPIGRTALHASYPPPKSKPAERRASVDGKRSSMKTSLYGDTRTSCAGTSICSSSVADWTAMPRCCHGL